MEFFNKAKSVRLGSHLNKFLVANEDEQTVRQSRNGASGTARWTVEKVEGKSHVIRLKSCHGKYLTPSDEPFLLGMTGKKVIQDIMASKRDSSVEWEPIKDGGRVKLRGQGGKFLRANGGMPPWRNSVTYDVPEITATQDWVLWEVDVVDITELESQEINLPSYNASPASSFSSLSDNRIGGYAKDNRAVSFVSNGSAAYASGRQSGMEFFHGAKAVRLQGHLGKYLVADDDEETVRQSRNGSSQKARWAVEYVEGKPNVIRLKSCHGLYLSATNEPFLLGMTGKRVQQYPPHTKLDSTIEWEPIKEGALHVKLKTIEGKFLRGNGGTPPWRNSVTHDIPHRTATQDWVLWGVDVVDISMSDTESISSSLSVASSFSSVVDDFSGSPDTESAMVNFRGFGHAFTSQSSHLTDASPSRSDGRVIYYRVADDNGNADEGIAGNSFHFREHGLEELTQKLEEETGLENIIVCSRNPLNGKLYPLRLALPPNNTTMHIVVVPPTSKAARDFMSAST